MDISSKACSLTATGFFFLSSICIAPFNSSRYGATGGFRRGPSFCTTRTVLNCISCTISNFLGYFYFFTNPVRWIQLPYFPTMLYPTKAKNRRLETGMRANAPYNFLYFSQLYTVHILVGSAKKSSWIFLMCACANYSVTIFLGKYVYI